MPQPPPPPGTVPPWGPSAPPSPPSGFQPPPTWSGQPPPWHIEPPARRRWVVPVAIAVVAVSAVALAVVVFLAFGPLADPLPWTLTVGPTGDLAEVTLPVGACADVDPYEARRLDDAAAVSCEAPHQFEVVAREELEAPTEVLRRGSPGDDAVLDTVDRWCLNRFELYVDAHYYHSDFDYLPLLPDEQRWGAGEREVICLAVPFESDHLIGSVRGSGR
jgi:hypothetical protein